jgi:hypothetical protein
MTLTLEELRARSDKGRAYYAANREARIAYQRAYYQRKRQGWAARREARLADQRHPIMNTKLGQIVMGVLRENAALYTRVTGVKHDLDHITPLCVGGEHAPWNLRPLPSRDNATRRKALA